MQIDEITKYGVHAQIVELLRNHGVRELTTTQVAAFEGGLCAGENLLVAAPTSTGKTLVAEIAAVQGALRGRKCVYLLTHRALAEEKYREFRAKYSSSESNWFNVSISTGDRQEGGWENGILVATYEKFLAAIVGQKENFLREAIVVADEIQILGDDARGHDVEVLCTLISRSHPSQLIGLSATIPNIETIAEWLNCKPVRVTYRDVPLRQEIWFEEYSEFREFGEEESQKLERDNELPRSTLSAVDELLNCQLGPVLVFTMTRLQARNLAAQYANGRPLEISSLGLTEQLALFSEPTSLSGQLRATSEKRVTFHTADLTHDERAVIETGLRENMFDVVFATPTLAAGVNFPIRTVLFDAYYRGYTVPPSWISQEEYINMAGRAGRKGYHDEGLVILRPKNNTDLYHARNFLSNEPRPLQSKLFKSSLRKSILALFASSVCESVESAHGFFKETLWHLQMVENESGAVAQLSQKITEAIEWLIDEDFLARSGDKITPTIFGSVTATSGLLPQTAAHLTGLLKKHQTDIRDNFDAFVLPILVALCASDEFISQEASRWLPYAVNDQPEAIAWEHVSRQPTLLDLGSIAQSDKVINGAYALFKWNEGATEAILNEQLPSISFGYMQDLARNAAWVLDGLSTIVSNPAIGFQAPIPARLKMLKRTVRFGVPAEALDIIEASDAGNVPGLGRERSIALLREGFAEPNEILAAEQTEIGRVVHSDERARLLFEALIQRFGIPFAYWEKRHVTAQSIDETRKQIVADAYKKIGADYEDPVIRLLNEAGLKAEKFDKGGRQRAPDIVISSFGRTICAECKTKASTEATVSSKEAFDVLGKSADINKDHCVTIGKPDFDSLSKSKAAASRHITLIPHKDLIEVILRVWSGRISVESLMTWLMTPGLADANDLILK